jgi:AraC-like DNA-binding protein
MIVRSIPLPVYREKCSGKKVAPAQHIEIVNSSRHLSWNGIYLEIAKSPCWHVEDLMVEGHIISLNFSDNDLHYQVRNDNDRNWRQICRPPGAFWINPEGTPFSIKHDKKEHCYATFFIDGKFLDELMGGHYEIQGSDVIVDNVLLGLAHTLISIVQEKEWQLTNLSDRIIADFVSTFASRYGRLSSARSKGGITLGRLNALLAWIQKNLQYQFTVKDMAAQVGLSPAHFSREFKSCMGLSPWEYVTQLRLEGARKALEAGGTVSDTAMKFGFSDSSHLSHKFKQAYKLSPSVFIKRQRGWYTT